MGNTESAAALSDSSSEDSVNDWRNVEPFSGEDTSAFENRLCKERRAFRIARRQRHQLRMHEKARAEAEARRAKEEEQRRAEVKRKAHENIAAAGGSLKRSLSRL